MSDKSPETGYPPGPRNIGILSLIRYKFPVQAIVSILHRISGVFLFIFIPIVIWAFDCSMKSPATFAKVSSAFDNGGVEFVIWFFASMLAYHFCAGVKHLIMDMGFFDSKISSRIASYLMLIIAAALIALLGVWIW